jgi:hypothetical protein
VALIGVLAAVGVLSAVSDASATVEPPVVTGNNLTVTSDAAGDTITLAVAAGVVTVNGAGTTLAAEANAQIVGPTRGCRCAKSSPHLARFVCREGKNCPAPALDRS